MRLLVCGGRDFSATDAFNWLQRNAYAEIAHALGDYTSFRLVDAIIHGGARGADEGAAQWGASEPACKVLAFPADWKKHGKAAGPIRNAQMLREGKPDMVIAFPGGRGTANMISLAEAEGIPVYRVEHF